jgi:hypothetical protein
MVAPFKSYTKSISLNRIGTMSDGRWFTFKGYIMTASGTSQKPPYVNTAYTCDIQHAYGGCADAASWAVSPQGVTETEAINQAKARFSQALGSTSQLGSTLTSERRATLSTITGGIATIFQSAKALKSGNVIKAAKLLGVSPPIERTTVKLRRKKGKLVRVTRRVLVLPTGREVSHSISSKWLWWSYGVQPLAQDIYNAVDVVQRPPPPTKVVGRSFATRTERYGGTTYVWKSHVMVSANVRIINPDLFIANQLGLTNPVQWVLEGIPFSFVLDWFSNLSQVVSQLTEGLGLEIAEPMTATRSSVKETFVWWGATDIKDWTTVKRELSVPTVKLHIAYERFNWQRGANAISLLVQFLEKK